MASPQRYRVGPVASMVTTRCLDAIRLCLHPAYSTHPPAPKCILGASPRPPRKGAHPLFPTMSTEQSYLKTLVGGVQRGFPLWQGALGEGHPESTTSEGWRVGRKRGAF